MEKQGKFLTKKWEIGMAGGEKGKNNREIRQLG
jgi:hypothetical protein